jgi:hypothetical protein
MSEFLCHSIEVVGCMFEAINPFGISILQALFRGQGREKGRRGE